MNPDDEKDNQQNDYEEIETEKINSEGRDRGLGMRNEGREDPPNEESGSDKPKYIQPKILIKEEISNQWFTLTKPILTLKFSFHLYAKCVLHKPLKCLTFRTGQKIERPEGTCMRLGNEVFLCPQYRSLCTGDKPYIFWCIFSCTPFIL